MTITLRSSNRSYPPVPWAPGEVEWAEAGAPDAWPGFVEEIKDASQEDGGDVILRTELDSAGTALVSGQYGFARQSTSIQKAAYQMAGLTMKFYANSRPIT